MTEELTDSDLADASDADLAEAVAAEPISAEEVQSGTPSRRITMSLSVQDLEEVDEEEETTLSTPIRHARASSIKRPTRSAA